MKIFILVSFLFLPTISFSAITEESELFKQTLSQYLDKKYQKIIKSSSDKLKVDENYLLEKIKVNKVNQEQHFQGHIKSSYGLCEIKGVVSFIKMDASAKCIDENLRGKIIFL